MAKRKAESREGMIITTIALPAELHRRLALAALEDNAAIAQVMRDAIEEHLKRRTRDHLRRKS
jgi:predicted transcriptional regulator